MRTHAFIRGMILTIAASAFVLVLTTCGSGQKRAMNPPSIGSGSLQAAEGSHRVTPAFQPVTDASLNDTLTELDALETPAGVDPALFAQLKDTLEEALICRVRSRAAPTGDNAKTVDGGAQDPTLQGKLVSTPPTGDENRVTDLTLTDNGDGTFTLAWHYRNLGDYDQNGTVDILDILPLAEHFGEEVPGDDDNSLQAVIDGSGNGAIDIADITPLAMNFGVECAGYSIRGASSYPGSLDETSEIGTVELADAAGEGRKCFNEPLPESEHQFFAVAPYDGVSDLGELSNVVILQMPVWHTLTIDNAGQVGSYTSLAVVNGNPAISYYDDTNSDLKYVRAIDASGSSWGTPQAVDSTGSVGYWTSLCVVNGNPAVSYNDWTNGDLKYVRATDPSGSSWESPVTVDSAGDVGRYTSLAVVNGNPAISYWDNTNGDLKYARASDANGGSWETPVAVDSTGYVGYYISLAIVNGNPAISYFDNTNDALKYVRACDASGGSWGTPVTVDSAGKVGGFTSLAVVNGSPAISYYDWSNGNLKFAIYY